MPPSKKRLPTKTLAAKRKQQRALLQVIRVSERLGLYEAEDKQLPKTERPGRRPKR